MGKAYLSGIRPLLLALLLPLLGACATPAQLHDPAYNPLPPILPPPPAPATGAIYNTNSALYLFEDVKARRVGDLITVILQEKTAASKKASTSSGKNTGIDISVPNLFGYDLTAGQPTLSAQAKSNSSFKGDGASSQSNTLEGNITVTVVGVYPNGNLLVRGEKLLTLNEGSEVVRIAGIVRPYDISTSNTIRSTQIGNVEITYSGNGLVGDSSKAGWLARFFNSPWWPL